MTTTVDVLRTAIQDLQAANANRVTRDQELRDTLDQQLQALRDKFSTEDARSLHNEGRIDDVEAALGSTQPGDIDSLGTLVATMQTTAGLGLGDVGKYFNF